MTRQEIQHMDSESEANPFNPIVYNNTATNTDPKSIEQTTIVHIQMKSVTTTPSATPVNHTSTICRVSLPFYNMVQPMS